MKYVDPDGNIIETFFDIFFTLYDIGNAVEKSSTRDHSGWADVGIDLAAAAIPGIPAGLSKVDDIVKIANKVDDVADSVKAIDNAKDLHRPYIRKSTREAVESNALKTADGKFIAPNTGIVIDGKYDLGHKP